MDAEELQARVDAAGVTPDAPMAWWRALRSAGPVAVPTAGTLSWDGGAADANAAIDAGAGALLLVSETVPGIHSRAVAALYCAIDATAVTPTSRDDFTWMQQCAEIRDAIPALRQRATDPARLTDADPELAWLTACIAHTAARRTPIIVAGALPTIAALCAQRISDAITSWVQIGMADDDVVARAAQRRIGRTPWMTSILPTDRGARIALLRTALDSLDGAEPRALSD